MRPALMRLRNTPHSIGVFSSVLTNGLTVRMTSVAMSLPRTPIRRLRWVAGPMTTSARPLAPASQSPTVRPQPASSMRPFNGPPSIASDTCRPRSSGPTFTSSLSTRKDIELVAASQVERTVSLPSRKPPKLAVAVSCPCVSFACKADVVGPQIRLKDHRVSVEIDCGIGEAKGCERQGGIGGGFIIEDRSKLNQIEPLRGHPQ